MKSEAHIKPSWSFSVGRLEDLDIDRILAEVPPEKLWCIIADGEGKPVCVFIRQSWLDVFEESDRVGVTRESMYNNWGRAVAPVLEHAGRRLSRSRQDYMSSADLPRGWRVSTWCLDATPLETILSELEAAEKFRRRIPVRVYVGGGK